MQEIQLDVHGPTHDQIVLTLDDRPKLFARAGFEEVTHEPDPAAVRRLLAAFAKLRLPVTPVGGPMGLDGITYRLKLSAGTTVIEYTWWTDVPKNWTPLMRIAKRFIALSGLRIPWMRQY